MPEEIYKEEKIFTQHDVENKQLKEENEKLRKEENEKLRKEENEKLRKENEQLRKNNVVKDAEIKESIEKPKEIKSPEEDKNTTDSYPNWFDKNKFKNILAITDSNKFNYRQKIGEFRYTEIKDLVNNIRNNTISEIFAKKDLNTLNEIKNAEIIKYKKRTPGHKELLNLFNDLLDIILTDKTLESESQEDKNKNENEKVESRKEENENENKDENEDEDYDDDETMSQNKKNPEIIKEKNDILDEIIDKSKSFEEQIKLLEKRKDPKGFWPYDGFGDRELRSKYFKIKLADMLKIIDKKLFETIFDHTLEKLANELINTTNKEENQIIVNNINKNKDKLYEQDDFSDWVIQPNDQRINIIDVIDLILNFNESIQLDLV